MGHRQTSGRRVWRVGIHFRAGQFIGAVHHLFTWTPGNRLQILAARRDQVTILQRLPPYGQDLPSRESRYSAVFAVSWGVLQLEASPSLLLVESRPLQS